MKENYFWDNALKNILISHIFKSDLQNWKLYIKWKTWNSNTNPISKHGHEL